MESRGILQWDEIYPTLEDFASDISEGQLFVGTVSRKISVTYTMNSLSDEAYGNGRWKMPEKSFVILHRLCVHPEFQNLGLEGKTMRHMEHQVSGLGTEAVRLDVYSQNPYALRLYQKCRYTEVGTVIWRKGAFYLMEKYL